MRWLPTNWDYHTYHFWRSSSFGGWANVWALTKTHLIDLILHLTEQKEELSLPLTTLTTSQLSQLSHALSSSSQYSLSIPLANSSSQRYFFAVLHTHYVRGLPRGIPCSSVLVSGMMHTCNTSTLLQGIPLGKPAANDHEWCHLYCTQNTHAHKITPDVRVHSHWPLHQQMREFVVWEIKISHVSKGYHDLLEQTVLQ